ncbi:hypothetical protein PF005_g5232 [Phytophthora fragariae]|uniref:Myb/SANT-like domain-containing protein n=1 Tax=Phytophthora fragariae TaxID=53985 RepID=A0A6A4A566_9STRA|nr:hypothetical protein PF003_g2694 [Phytophthora fragariae]KAE8944774.1 hypothetical protein PF009_g5563 [Phytophthora fragariae]KAE9023043.1 hypothetical protein PF011_g4180 [Phytophthora fragariae]KAE9128514.1 hypothetical protein PF007_g5240 [Phytophthora fragariae]KAE9128646.1 hypothetical protein PF010_g4434 [Phytophthora fragariae]
MVFRINHEQDQELMRKLIRLKPFAAKRGTTGSVWEAVVKGVSSAIGVQVHAKQVRDRLNLLKARFKVDELVSSRGSGVEEALHYDDLNGFVGDYIELERNYNDTKSSKNAANEKK